MIGFGERVRQSQRVLRSYVTPESSWRHLKIALEGPAECSFRTVPESMSHLTRAHVLLTNPTPGKKHAPTCHVLHGRHPHYSRESVRKNGSREVDLFREGRHRPGFFGTAMDQRKSTPNVRITQRPEPAKPSA